MPQGKRQAVIVGINEYKDADIPKLTGAVYDATDMSERLRQFGDFEIADDHFLLDSDAVCHKIRKAISDLLWQTDPCDLSLFYFSGHGFVDGRGNGYIAPCDMVKNEPFVCGINMQELKQVVLNSINKSSVLMILDCCYSGIPTKGDKSPPDIKAPLDPYFQNLEAEGKIILASSGEDEKSREIPNCRHENASDPHPHGTFTFHLIEGLEGKAADPAGTGIITLDSLKRYVENELTTKGKQRPRCFVADASLMGGIRIAVTPKQHKEYINQKIQTAKDYSSDEDPALVIGAVDIVNEVFYLEPENPEALNLKGAINISLAEYQELVNRWMFENVLEIRPKIRNAFRVIDKLTDWGKFDKIKTLDRRQKTLLFYLCQVSKEIINKDEFIIKCRPYDNPYSTPKMSPSKLK